VYAWGYGGGGRLGITLDAVGAFKPKLVDSLRDTPCHLIAAGESHSMAITHTRHRADRGQLYTWGEGDYGKLGHGDRLPQV
jgi:E3 ubiquitin-protein ligase HERC2